MGEPDNFQGIEESQFDHHRQQLKLVFSHFTGSKSMR